MAENHLEPVWQAILHVYQEFARVCERHHLRFYLTDGTAIGAVRHHGFIPWDDDLDVSMPREDYEKFLQVAPQELPGHLAVVAMGRAPGFAGLMGKVQETRREVVEQAEREAGYTLSNGIFIDIFPFDGWSGSKLAGWWHKLQFLVLNCASNYQRHTFRQHRFKGRVSWVLGALLSPWCGDLRDDVQRLLKYQAVYGVCPVGSMPYTARVRCWEDRRLVLPAAVWGKPVMVDFCGIPAPLPEQYDYYLRQDYGDYMQLPPETKRKTTHSADGVHHPWWLGPQS